MDFPFFGLLCLLVGIWGAALWRRFALRLRWVRPQGGMSLYLAFALLGIFLPLPMELVLPPFLALVPLPFLKLKWSLPGLLALGLTLFATLGSEWQFALLPASLLFLGLDRAGQAWAWRSWAGVLWIPALGGLGLWAELEGKATEASILFYGLALCLIGLLLVGRRPLPLGPGPWRFLSLLFTLGLSLLVDHWPDWLFGLCMLLLLLSPLVRPQSLLTHAVWSRKGRALTWMGLQAGLTGLALFLVQLSH